MILPFTVQHSHINFNTVLFARARITTGSETRIVREPKRVSNIDYIVSIIYGMPPPIGMGLLIKLSHVHIHILYILTFSLE